MEIKSICCQNQGYIQNNSSDNTEYYSGETTTGNEKEKQAGNTSYLTELTCGLSRCIFLKNKGFIFFLKDTSSSINGDGFSIIYDVEVVKYESSGTVTYKCGEMHIAILPNYNRYKVTFNELGSNANQEDKDEYKKSIESKELYNTNYNIVVKEFEQLMTGTTSHMISPYMMKQIFGKSKVKKLSHNDVIEAFGTSGDAYAYTKAKALKYMKKYSLNVIVVEEPRHGISKPRIAITSNNGKWDKLISFECDKITSECYKGYHIIKNGTEV